MPAAPLRTAGVPPRHSMQCTGSAYAGSSSGDSALMHQIYYSRCSGSSYPDSPASVSTGRPPQRAGTLQRAGVIMTVRTARRVFLTDAIGGYIMAKKDKGAVYRVTEVIGTSSESWEDAARTAIN